MSGGDLSDMLWGNGAVVTVPIGPWILLFLGFVLGVCFVLAKRSRTARAVPLLVVLLVPVTSVIAVNFPLILELPHNFSNGEVANADELNANFAALESHAAAQNEAIVDNFERHGSVELQLQLLDGALQAIPTEYYDCVWTACVDTPRYMFCADNRVVVGIDMPEFGGNEGSCNSSSLSGPDDYRLRCCRVRAQASWDFVGWPNLEF